MRAMKLLLVCGLALSAALLVGAGVRVPGNDAGNPDGATPEPPVVHVVIANLDDIPSATPRYEPFIFTTHTDHVLRTAHDCRVCHHDQKDAAAPQACSACHNRPEIEPRLKDAMHQTCLTCHRREAEKNPASPVPLACLNCHTERK